VIFIYLAVDFGVAYLREENTQPRKTPLSMRFRVFAGALALAIVLILIRCGYRIDELSDGYNVPLIHKEGLFIGLERV